MREGKLAPDRAEELAFATGQPPFVRVTEADRLSVQAAQWPLTLAIFWTAWEDLDQVVRAQADFRFWKGAVWRNTKQPKQEKSFAEAEHTVFEALKSERWKASALFQGSRQSIEPQTWTDVVWEDKFISDVLITPNHQRIERALIENALVMRLRSDGDNNEIIERAWRKGGAPEKYDKIEFLLTVMKIVYTEARGFSSIDELNNKAISLFHDANGLGDAEPSPSWGRPLTKKLWDFLEIERSRKNTRR